MSALMQRLMADKGKASLMLGLVAVLLLMWGRLMLKQVPRQAVAEPAAAAAVTQAAGGKSGKRLWAAPVVEFTAPDDWSRDLFAVDTARYARNPQNDVKAVAKSDPQASDELLESTVVKKAAAGLTLQTTMLGGEKPRAMIDGQVIEQGQQIHGFTLKKVESRWVVLEMNGIEVELGM